MIKLIHVIFILTSFVSFIGRIALSEFKPEVLQKKIVKIAPHVIDTILLLSGIGLVIQGRWMDGEYGWIESKVILLVCYIVLGVVAMRLNGVKRWLAFVGAIACYGLILSIAVTKNGFI
jgi:uncharacterized membrane protein SirB2